MYVILAPLKETVIAIHVLELLRAISLSLWNWKERTSTVKHVLFQPVSVARDTEIYLKLGME